MPLSRRSVLIASAAGVAAAGGAVYFWSRGTKPVAPNPAAAATAPQAPPAVQAAPAPSAPVANADPRKTPRVIGSASAPITVTEFFSLTCSHCAAFTRDTFPQIKSALIDTGKIRWVFSDYPLDRTALTAAMIARSLPEDLYEPFVVALYQGQMNWAFNSAVDPIDGLAREAALAGMPRSKFDQIAADSDLQNFILQERTDSTSKYHIDGTPTFRAGGPKATNIQQTGEMDFDGFNAFLAKAG